ncbi:hypothetical protein TWF696_000858 [Orbilia brochopaga]|uniref:FAD-binding PCMH-type domain-containing protein n=1 Tax=Orbilia brochopaga TaxID=3140254 RepID=A0AAV9VCK6_9PEZI
MSKHSGLYVVHVGSGLTLQSRAWHFTNPTTCCSLLDGKFTPESKVFSPQSPEYGPLAVYWTPAARLNPTCIFTPANAADVSRAVKLFGRKNCQFAIRSGGHSYNPGWAGIANGILISLSNLNEVTYNPQTGLAIAGTGNRWGDVYAALAPYNITAIGGRNSDIGLGGYLTGGGISYYANKVGWAADNIKSVEIVLANGQIINADRYHHSELFRSIKGGSSNFGIATKFVLETVDASGPFNGIGLRYPFASTDALLAAAYSYCTGGSDADPKSHIIFSSTINGTQPLVNVLLMAYDGVFNAANPPTVLKPFFDGTIPNPSFSFLTANGTSREAAYILNLSQKPGTRYTMGTLSIHVDYELLRTLRSIWIEETTPDLQTASGFAAEFAFQPVGRKWLAASAAKGGNSMGIKAPLAVLWMQPRWNSASDDAAMVAYTLRVIQRFEQAAKDAGKLAKFRYLNYGNRYQDIISHYGRQDVRRLQRVKAHYDPNNVFHRLVPGGFKIPGF